MFVVFEGPDGSGKTTQSKMLAEWMSAEWRCFPDRRTSIGKLIDGHLKGYWEAQTADAPPLKKMAPDELAWHDSYGGTKDALMFQALQLANRVEVMPSILATLRSGKHVICDRYWGSGYAYGKSDGLDTTYLLKIHEYLPEPALNILIDVPIEVAVKRLASREGRVERYEGNVGFMETVANNYRELWALKKTDPRWVVVDGSGSQTATQEKLRSLIPLAVLKR